MPANFTLSSGASFTVRDQTIHGDSGNTTITDSYNTTTTKVVGSHNTSTTTDNGTYHSNYYGEDYSSKRRSGGSKNSRNPYTRGYNYSDYNPAYSQPHPTDTQNNYQEQHDANSNYGLRLGPGSPRTPPPAPTSRMNQLPTTPGTPSPFRQPQPLFLTPVQEQTFQPFAMAPTWPSYPTANEEPTQNLSPKPTGLGLGLEMRDGSRSPNPFVARIQSRATSPLQSTYPTRSPQPVYGEILYSTPAPISPRPEIPPATPPEAYENFGFATPRTEAGMISPLHLPSA